MLTTLDLGVGDIQVISAEKPNTPGYIAHNQGYQVWDKINQDWQQIRQI